MQVRNNTSANLQFMVRMNSKTTDSFLDQHGNTITQPERPKVETLHIPPMALVEVEDNLWNLAAMTSTTVPITEEETEVISGISLGGQQDPQPVTRTIKVPTGKTRKVNLMKEMIQKGDLEIVVKPASLIAPKAMRLQLKEAGITVKADLHEDAVAALFDRILG